MGYMGYIVHTHIYGYDIVQIGQITLPMSDLSWYVPYTTYTLYVRFQKRTFQTKAHKTNRCPICTHLSHFVRLIPNVRFMVIYHDKSYFVSRLSDLYLLSVLSNFL